MNSLNNVIPGYYCAGVTLLRCTGGFGIPAAAATALEWDVESKDDLNIFDYGVSPSSIVLPSSFDYYRLTSQVRVGALPQVFQLGLYMMDGNVNYVNSGFYSVKNHAGVAGTNLSIDGCSGIIPIEGTINFRTITIKVTSNASSATSTSGSSHTFLSCEIFKKY